MRCSTPKQGLAKRSPRGCSPRSSQSALIEPGVLGVNSVEDGIFLSKNLHSLFALWSSAFLKVREVDINSENF